MNQKIFFLLFLLLFQGKVFSQVISVVATTDKERIVIGEPIKLKLEVTIPASSGLSWLQIDTLPHFEVLDRSDVDSITSFNGLRLEQTITLTSWDSGSWVIPSLAFQNMRSRPLRIEVGYSPMDPDQPYHDIKDIMDVPKPEKPEWYWYLLALALLLILFLLFFPASKNKGVKKEPVKEDPYKLAMKQLSSLDPGLGSKVFFTDLVNIFREYLEQRENIRSHSKTSDDLVVQLRELALPQDDYTRVAQLLRMSDLVKYARMETGIDEKNQSLLVVKENIQRIETKRK
jgi:hypothetical protein